MSKRIMGVETEYAVAPFRGSAGTPDGALLAAGALLGEVRRRLPFLPDTRDGVFLGNGSRLYVDPSAGRHLEYSTCETQDPFEAVIQTLAGDAILFELGGALVPTRASDPPFLSKLNVNYTSRLSWACHHSHGHRADRARLPDEMTPHFVSLVLLGAGGLNPFSPGIEFCLSPRAFFLTECINGNSTAHRPIFHDKDEPLAASGWHRLHWLGSSRVESHLASVLELGSTAILLALVEAGLSPAQGLRLADPVQALHGFSADTTLQATARTSAGEAVSAIDLQCRLLDFVERHADHPGLPPWTGRVCALWRDTLNRLAQGPKAVASRLDWAIKLQLYGTHLAARGFSLAELPALNRAVPALVTPAGGDAARRQARTEVEAGDASPSDDRLRAFLCMRDELCELEYRFSAVGPQGLFGQLDRAGLLAGHHLPEVTPERVSRAMVDPPGTGRARLRGQVVRQLHPRAPDYICDWAMIRSRVEFLDLGNPLQEEMPAWRRIPEPTPSREGALTAAVRRIGFAEGSSPPDAAIGPAVDRVIQEHGPASFVPLRRRAYEFFLEGHYREAESILRRLLACGFDIAGTHVHLARLCLLMSREPEARAAIAAAWEQRGSSDRYVALRVLYFQTVFALLEGRDGHATLQAIAAGLQEPRAHEDWTIGVIVEHLAPRLSAEARELLAALGAALGDGTRVEALARLPAWQRILASPPPASTAGPSELRTAGRTPPES